MRGSPSLLPIALLVLTAAWPVEVLALPLLGQAAGAALAMGP